MHVFFEKGTRGGISYIFHKDRKNNNKYLKPYDPKQESKHVIYLDANNLYGYAMSKFLPTRGFKPIDLKEFDLNKYTSNKSKGRVLEVDLEYSKELWELQNDYPLAPDKIEIKREIVLASTKDCWFMQYSYVIYGKTMEKLRNRINMTLANN